MTCKIRVGIIGSGGWARYGHIPALQALDGFEVVALAGRNKEKVQKYADGFNIEHAFGSAEELIAFPGVDLVVVLAPTPEHGRLAKAAIEAGKDVYSEWPLSTTTAESEHLLSLAREKGVKHVVGLQRRLSPSSRYWRDLVRQGYVGKIRAVRMSVGVDAFGQVMPEFAKWALDAANFTHVLSIYGGHFHDMLFHGVGFPAKLAAVVQNQFPVTTIAETGEKFLTPVRMKSWRSVRWPMAVYSRFNLRVDKCIARVCRSISPVPKVLCELLTQGASRTPRTTRFQA